MLNWYKLANIWDEIKKFGPNSEISSIDDPRVEYLAEHSNYTKEQAFKYLQDIGISDYYKRDYFTGNYGWSVPSKEAIEELKKFINNETVLEIGSGYGLWAKLLKDAGVNVIATDLPFSNKQDSHRPKKIKFTEIEEIDAEVTIQKYIYKPYVLMMSWPPYDDPMAAKSLKGFKGNKLIFIGEGEGGCTGDDQFFKILKTEWNFVKEINIPQWSGIHDYISLYDRK